MNILVTICARGGSKGVKNKNLKIVQGLPLIAHTIRQALKWGRALAIVVSTDSDAIAQVAKEYGALVPFMRPTPLAQDDTPKIPVIRHALLESEKFFHQTYDLIVDLDATAPIRGPHDLENCYQKYLTQKPNLLFSVVKAHKNPYFNMVQVDEKGWAQLVKPLPDRITRRQDAPKVYDMNASIYFYSRAKLLDENANQNFFDRSIIYEMDELSAYDLDREVDFKFMEFLLQEGMVKL